MTHTARSLAALIGQAGQPVPAADVLELLAAWMNKHHIIRAAEFECPVQLDRLYDKIAGRVSETERLAHNAGATVCRLMIAAEVAARHAVKVAA